MTGRGAVNEKRHDVGPLTSCFEEGDLEQDVGAGRGRRCFKKRRGRFIGDRQ